MHNIIRDRVIARLLEIAANPLDSGASHAEQGLCYLMAEIVYSDYTGMGEPDYPEVIDCEMALDEIKGMFRSWPLYSGNVLFPVPAADPRTSPRGAFFNTRYKWQGEYGEKRLNLLYWILGKLQRQKELDV